MQGPSLLGASVMIKRLRAEVALAARSHAKVLILGETGVGKEVVARLVHMQGARASCPFVAVNCSGIPETLLESELFGHVRGSFTGAFRDKVGLIQQANGGTLFLDELGEMSLRMQAMLLRFAETGEVQRVGSDSGTLRTDVRLITATNRDLRAQIDAGAFREDMYYRLNLIRIQVPPLRERGEDVLLLLEHYLQCAARAHDLPMPSLSEDAARLLLTYAWPGNVRELRNVAERLVLQDRVGPLMPEDLQLEIRGTSATGVIVGALPSEDSVPRPMMADTGMTEQAQQLWARLESGEDFWAVVHEAFKTRELTRAELVSIIDRALQETCGHYRDMLRLFHLPPSDYKRFHAFLYQQRANLPVAPYRNLRRRSSIPVYMGPKTSWTGPS